MTPRATREGSPPSMAHKSPYPEQSASLRGELLPTWTPEDSSRTLPSSNCDWLELSTKKSARDWYESGSLVLYADGLSVFVESEPTDEYQGFQAPFPLLPSAVLESKSGWLWYNAGVAQNPARDSWLSVACEQLKTVNEEADEEGIERPSADACAFAERFIQALASIALPPACVFPDDDRSVSIQIGQREFIFLLTCFEGGSGKYNAVHDTFRVSGSYNDLSLDRIADSPFLQQLKCMLRSLSENVGFASQTK